MRALVADDDRIGATILSAALERWGLEVVLAQDGNEAWRIAQSEKDIAIAILDWEMPGLDGPEVCRRIRGDASLRRTYIILLTGRGNRPDIVAGLDAGADDYVVKPFDDDELRARVHVGLRVMSLQQELTERVADLQSALSRVKTLTGLLPICSYCKKIRSDNNYWEQLESYIAHHSEAQFSHGICPSCFDTVSADLNGEQ
jgi:phosphoserine phosphatase RsbU/P